MQQVPITDMLVLQRRTVPSRSGRRDAAADPPAPVKAASTRDGGLVYIRGQTEIDLERREIRDGGISVPIGGRALEVAEILLNAGGRPVGKDALMQAIWPGAIVEDNTLQVHISALRKALGPAQHQLKNVYGQGYQLLGTWTRRHARTAAAYTTFPPSPTAANHVRQAGLIGRERSLAAVTGMLAANRLVTLVGPGGVGKSQLAMTAARAQPEAMTVIDLSEVTDGAAIVATIGKAVGLADGVIVSSLDAVCHLLRPQRMLLVLDNCEHVAAEAAALADSALRAAPGIRLLVTSTEPLRLGGEVVFRVPPLSTPSGLADAAEGSAMALFVARLKAADPRFQPDPVSIALIRQICCRLDGIPLGIEIAARSAATLGVKVVAGCLDHGFDLPAGGRRAAPPRQQTLRARFDWSYRLLTAPQQKVLQRLSVIDGSFDLDAAVAAVGDDEIGSQLAEHCLAELVHTSLLTIERQGSTIKYRMFAADRAHAQQRLERSPEAGIVRSRHASDCRDGAVLDTAATVPAPHWP